MITYLRDIVLYFPQVQFTVHQFIWEDEVVKALVIGTGVHLNLPTPFVVIHFLSTTRWPLNGFETQK